MSDSPYERVKGGRLTFKGGALATRSKSIDKKPKKKKRKTEEHPDLDDEQQEQEQQQDPSSTTTTTSTPVGGDAIYTIDAARKMKYDQLFPVEAKKFKYDPTNAKAKSVEEALDDRVKKKADRYCK